MLHLKQLRPTLIHLTVDWLLRHKSKNITLHCQPHQSRQYLLTLAQHLPRFPIVKVTLGEEWFWEEPHPSAVHTSLILGLVH